MTLEDQIRDEKLQYDIKTEAAKISALSSGIIDKHEYLTGEEILPSNQQQIIEQAKFTYSPLRKAFEKQAKTIEDQGEKQICAIQNKEFNKSIEKAKFDSDSDLAVLRQKELHNELAEEMKTEIKENFNKLLLNHSSDIDFKDFIKICKKCTAEPYSFLINDTILLSNDPLRFRKNLLK